MVKNQRRRFGRIRNKKGVLQLNAFEAAILGLIQGLTEFLPVSSSGHLAITQNIFGVDESQVLFFAAMLHLGTLLSVFVAYYKDIAALLIELCETIADVVKGRGLQVNKNKTRRLGFMIIVSAIPTGIIGIALSDFFESLFTKMAFIGVGLILTGTLLFLAERFAGGKKGIYEMRFRDAFLIGLCQSVAIAPGISRSGSTLVGGLFTGLKRPLAVKFAFLMSIPPILGSGILEIKGAIEQGLGDTSVAVILMGVIIAFVSGLLAIKLMVKVVTNKKLFYFSIYTWGAGALVVVLSLLGIL